MFLNWFKKVFWRPPGINMLSSFSRCLSRISEVDDEWKFEILVSSIPRNIWCRHKNNNLRETNRIIKLNFWRYVKDFKLEFSNSKTDFFLVEWKILSIFIRENKFLSSGAICIKNTKSEVSVCRKMRFFYDVKNSTKKFAGFFR